MCGIAGSVALRGRCDPSEVKRMLDRLRHRGPDHQASWADGHAVLGHTRLSVIDPSERSHQPMRDPETGNVLVFNGEIYNFQELRAGLEARGERFASRGDTEVLLSLYRRHGADCLAMLRGMFAFAVWEPRRERLFLARDRVGKKPLVYASTTRGLVFASELNALCEHPDVSRELDPGALDSYLSLQYVPAPHSIYRGVRKLPPASYAVFDGRGLEIRTYWEIDYRRKERFDEEEALDAVEQELSEAVRLRLISDVPLGALLSGGIDSSLVVALMARHSSRPVEAFSVGFEESRYDEVPHAAAVARHVGAVHHVEQVRMDALHALPDVTNRYGEPFADNSAIPTFRVCGMARKHVTVALSGDGGDELACGYSHYRRSRLADRVQRWLNPHGRLPEASRVQALDGRSLPDRARRHLLYRYVYPELKPLYRIENFQRRDKLSLVTPELAQEAERQLTAWRAELLRGAAEHAEGPVDRMLWIDGHAYLPNDVLVKADIASMAHGLELRCPLLDHKLIELYARLPVALKVRAGETKHLLRRLARKYLPEEVVARRKQGFSMPVAAWLRGSSQSAMRAALEAARPRLSPYLRFSRIDELLAEHAAGRANHGTRLWILWVLAEWANGAG